MAALRPPIILGSISIVDGWASLISEVQTEAAPADIKLQECSFAHNFACNLAWVGTETLKHIQLDDTADASDCRDKVNVCQLVIIRPLELPLQSETKALSPQQRSGPFWPRASAARCAHRCRSGLATVLDDGLQRQSVQSRLTWNGLVQSGYLTGPPRGNSLRQWRH